ncbi:MAG: class I SAM-dependent methyltransferase [Lactobacillaceae bacterium]|jgi:SAM-dependent methyltransferase|nr:class I SAM-dependent methyltransferase [Lactobacillaceae bacterium]
MQNNLYVLNFSTTLHELREKLEDLKVDSGSSYVNFEVYSNGEFKDEQVEKIKNNYMDWKKQTRSLDEALDGVDKSVETSINLKKLKWMDVQILDNLTKQAEEGNWILIVPDEFLQRQHKIISSLQVSLNKQEDIGSDILKAINIEMEKVKENLQPTDKKDVWERKWKNNTIDSYKKQNDREEPNVFSGVAIDYMRRNGYTRLLEVGPGAGRDTQIFVGSGLDVTAVEISGSAVERLRNDFPSANIIESDIRTFNPSSRLKVDAVYAFSALHYFNDDETTEIYKKLNSFMVKNGGLFAACRSVNDGMYGKGKEIGQDTFIFNGASRRFFSEKAMEKQLAKTGFEIENARERTIVYHNYDKGFESTFLEIIARKVR